jgi:hypothetical protein
MTAVNLKLKKPALLKGIQFTGKNSKEVAQWVREELLISAKAGGTYVQIEGDFKVQDRGDFVDNFRLSARLKKGQWIIAAVNNSEAHIYDNEAKELFFREVEAK